MNIDSPVIQLLRNTAAWRSVSYIVDQTGLPAKRVREILRDALTLGYVERDKYLSQYARVNLWRWKR